MANVEKTGFFVKKGRHLCACEANTIRDLLLKCVVRMSFTVGFSWTKMRKYCIFHVSCENWRVMVRHLQVAASPDLLTCILNEYRTGNVTKASADAQPVRSAEERASLGSQVATFPPSPSQLPHSFCKCRGGSAGLCFSLSETPEQLRGDAFSPPRTCFLEQLEELDRTTFIPLAADCL